MESIWYKKFPTYYGSVVRNASMTTSSENMDVLIIEDSVATASLLSDYLKQLNYKGIHTCKDGEAGIKKFFELSSSNRLPLVFLDYYLPDMDAVSVFEELIKAQPETKIIIATVAGKGEAGIKKFFELSSSNRSPLVFLDYYLPDMDAVTVFEELMESQPKTRIILETVGGKYDDGINYLIQQGAYHFLQKPFSFANLKETMNKFERERVTFA